MAKAFLSDRGIIRISGEDARSFLQGLLTADMVKLSVGAPAFAALLTPQGKVIVFRSIEVTHEDGRVTEIDLFADNADATNLMTDKERQQ